MDGGGAILYAIVAIIIVLILVAILWFAFCGCCDDGCDGGGFDGGRRGSSGFGFGGNGCCETFCVPDPPLLAIDVKGATGEAPLIFDALAVPTTGALAYDSGYVKVLETKLRTFCPPERETLMIDVSLASIMAVESVELANLVGAVSSELGAVTIQVLVDGVEAVPSPVVFNSLTLITQSPPGVPVAPSTTVASTLVKDAEANSFKFFYRNICPKCHTITVNARVQLFTTGDTAAALSAAAAAIGARTLAVQVIDTCPRSKCNLPSP